MILLGDKNGKTSRQISRTGLYHIIFRGISRQNVFEEEEEYEISKSYKKSIGYTRRAIMSEIDGQEPSKIKEFPRDERNKIIKKLVNEKGISKSALERATGISRGTIIRITK